VQTTVSKTNRLNKNKKQSMNIKQLTTYSTNIFISKVNFIFIMSYIIFNSLTILICFSYRKWLFWNQVWKLVCFVVVFLQEWRCVKLSQTKHRAKRWRYFNVLVQRARIFDSLCQWWISKRRRKLPTKFGNYFVLFLQLAPYEKEFWHWYSHA